jgi:hypothetical protein
MGARIARIVNWYYSARPPYLTTVLLLFMGCCFLLLLNGQVFTNALIFLGFGAVSGLLWCRLVLGTKHQGYQRLAFGVIVGHIVVMTALMIGLPAKYRWQQEFNNKVNELRVRTGGKSIND